MNLKNAPSHLRCSLFRNRSFFDQFSRVLPPVQIRFAPKADPRLADHEAR